MPEDIYCLFSHLLQTNTLHIPNRGQVIKPAAGFKLFATAEKMPNQYNLSNWLVNHIIPLSQDDLFEFSPLSIKSSSLLREILMMCYRELQKIKGNDLVNRDWFKLCNRVNYHVKSIYGDREMNNIVTESLRELIFLESMGVFLGTRDKNLSIEILAGVLNLNKTQLEAVYENRSPQLNYNENSIQIGKSPALITPSRPSAVNFACTPYTLRLLENICTGIANSESLLLVGETGNGKTTIVQSLASLLGVKLYVHNLSQVSDPSDIIGGFKPIAVSTLLAPLVSDFFDIFPNFLDKQANSELLSKLRLSYTQQKWNKVIKYMQFSYSEILCIINDQHKSFPSGHINSLHKLIEDTCITQKKTSKFSFRISIR